MSKNELKEAMELMFLIGEGENGENKINFDRYIDNYMNKLRDEGKVYCFRCMKQFKIDYKPIHERSKKHRESFINPFII